MSTLSCKKIRYIDAPDFHPFNRIYDRIFPNLARFFFDPDFFCEDFLESCVFFKIYLLFILDFWGNSVYFAFKMKITR